MVTNERIVAIKSFTSISNTAGEGVNVVIIMILEVKFLIGFLLKKCHSLFKKESGLVILKLI